MGFNPKSKENIIKHVHYLNDAWGNWSIDFDDDYISIKKLDESILVISINGKMLFSNSIFINSHESSIIFDMLQGFTRGVEQHKESKEDTFSMIEDERHEFDPEVKENIALHIDELNKFNNCWRVDFYDRYISIQKLNETIVTIDIAGPIRFSGSLGVSAIEARQIFKMLEEFTTGVDTIREFKGIF